MLGAARTPVLVVRSTAELFTNGVVVVGVDFSEGENIMTIERSLRMIAGAFVAASVLLGIYVNPLFHWFTLFVGLNLFQSAFTKWCPMMWLLKQAGLRPTERAAVGVETHR